MARTVDLVVGPAVRAKRYVPLTRPLNAFAEVGVGSVSVGVWQMACKRVIKVLERAVKNLVGE